MASKLGLVVLALALGTAACAGDNTDVDQLTAEIEELQDEVEELRTDLDEATNRLSGLQEAFLSEIGMTLDQHPPPGTDTEPMCVPAGGVTLLAGSSPFADPEEAAVRVQASTLDGHSVEFTVEASAERRGDLMSDLTINGRHNSRDIYPAEPQSPNGSLIGGISPIDDTGEALWWFVTVDDYIPRHQDSGFVYVPTAPLVTGEVNIWIAVVPAELAGSETGFVPNDSNPAVAACLARASLD